MLGRNVSVRGCELSRRLSDPTVNVASLIARGIGSKFALSVNSLLHAGKWQDIVSLAVDPSSYSDASEFRDDYLLSEFLSKFPEWDLGLDKAQVALAKFREVELQCAETNKRLSRSRCSWSLSPYTPESILWSARRKIARVLGPFSWDLAALGFAFGPGATTTLRSAHGDAYYKFKAKPCVTAKASVAALTSIKLVPQWYHHCVSLTGLSHEDFESLDLCSQIRTMFELSECNRVTTVPKNAKTDRTIAIEPQMNLYLQTGIGDYIARRLRRVGVDLRDQTWNQDLARLGSLTGLVDTIDLASASDSVSCELVKQLLPDDWVQALFMTRVSSGVLPSGEVVTYQKISSMGNGFNFPLETLIFWGIVQAVCDCFRLDGRLTAVYGDDIISPSAATHTIMWVLRELGFSPNLKKTHTTGVFRESCGKHFFRGVDVTPFYIRKSVNTVPRLYWLANQIRRWSRLYWGLDGRLRPAYDRVVSHIQPRRLRDIRIPEGFGDLGLVSDLDEALPARAGRGFDGWRFRTLVPRVSTRTYSDVCVLLRSLYTLEARPKADLSSALDLTSWYSVEKFLDTITGRPSAGSSVPDPARVRWKPLEAFTPHWPCYGPWVG